MNSVQNSLINVAAANPTKKPEVSSQAPEKDSFSKLMNDQKQNLEQSGAAANNAASKKPENGQTNTQAPSEQELESRIAMAAAAMMQTPMIVQPAIAPPENDQPVMLAPALQQVEADLDLSQVQQVQPQGTEQPGQMAVLVEELKTQSSQDTVVVQTQVPQKEELVQQPAPMENKDDSLNAMAQGQQGETPLFREIDSVPIQVGEAENTAKLEQKPVSDQLAKGIDQAMHSGESKLELELEPHNLGRVKIEMLLQEDGTMRVLLHAEKPQTQQLLQRDISDLQALLGRTTQQQVEVEAPQQQPQQQFNYDGQHGHEQQQQQHRRNHEENAEDFLHQLRLGLVDEE